MAENPAPRARYGEAFWRAHHEAWKRSDLNQREYCEAQGLPLKAFGNWRAKFKAEPQPPACKLLYRRGGARHSPGHTPSHSVGHSLSHATYPFSAPPPDPIVPPARAGHRRRFSAADRHHILAEAAMPVASVSEVARRYGIDRRVLCRWRQEDERLGEHVLRRIICLPTIRRSRSSIPAAGERRSAGYGSTYATSELGQVRPHPPLPISTNSIAGAKG